MIQMIQLHQVKMKLRCKYLKYDCVTICTHEGWSLPYYSSQCGRSQHTFSLNYASEK